MRNIIALTVLGTGAYLLGRFLSHRSSGRHAAFAEDQQGHGERAVRDAGPEAMRDPPGDDWSEVDEQADESFPASDPPGNY